MKKLIVIVVLFGIGCAKSSTPASSSSKGLFSIWTRNDLAISLDLRSMMLNTPTAFGVAFSNGALCQCTATMTGSMASGNYSLASCAYVSGGSGDPGCASLDETGTYSLSGNQLSLCDPTCGIYN